MAVSSSLNPGSIVKEKSSSAAGAQNFITGGQPLGKGVVSSAANKIVQFSRNSTAGVAAKPPDLNSMISTLSTNIVSNVQNQVSSINQNVTQFVQQKLSEIQDNYRSRMDQIDAARPNSILGNFLRLYKDAIGYIQFLGNPRNVKTLGRNIRALQKVFRETFRVARNIRQTILKIVKQLSSLPQASTGPGGINLDINVPGGPLKKSLPKGLMRMLRRRPGMAMAGGALLAAGGSRVISGMANLGRGSVDAAPMAEGTIPTTLLDRFSGILDRFSEAIRGFGTGGRQTQASTNPSGQPSGSPGAGDPGADPGSGATPGATPSASASGPGASGPQGPATRALLDTISFAEGTFDKPNRGYNTQFSGKQFSDLSRHPDEVIHSSRYSSAAAGRYQFMPQTWEGPLIGGKTSRRSDGIDFSPESQDSAAVKLIMMRLRSAGIKINTPQELEAYLVKEGGISANTANALSPEWASFPTNTGASYYDQPVKKLNRLQEFYQKRIGVQGSATQAQPPKVEPAPNQAQVNQAAAQSVAQPPKQTPVETAVVPMDMGSQGNENKPANTPTPPPPPTLAKQDQASLPFLTATNDDNFLSLYSRLTYNIVG